MHFLGQEDGRIRHHTVSIRVAFYLTSLLIFAPRYNKDEAKRLLNAIDENGKTSLFYCIQFELIDEAKELLTTKLIDTNIGDGILGTALHVATERADENTMDLLLNYGANADAQNEGFCFGCDIDRWQYSHNFKSFLFSQLVKQRCIWPLPVKKWTLTPHSRL